MDLKNSKPPNLPAVYGFADKFFLKVEPSLEVLLSKYKRILTLGQTIGSAYDSFEPFLLDYPQICLILSRYEVRDEGTWKLFWIELQKVSVYRQFEATKPLLEKIFDENFKSLKPQKETAKLDCDIKASAYATILNLASSHFDPKVFSNAFDSKGSCGRGQRIEGMQRVCNVLQRNYGLDSKLIDLYNLVVYRNSFAYHAYRRINTILNDAREHARGMVSIIIPHQDYVFNQWKDIMIWYGANKKIQTVCKELFVDDHEAGDFFSMVLYLRDFQLKVDPVETKAILLKSFLSNRKIGKKRLKEVIDNYKWCAPYWVRQAVKEY